MAKVAKQEKAYMGDLANDSEIHEPITIQIRLNGTTARTFRLARGVITFALTLTVVSALWGAGVAWWLAWSELSGMSADRELAKAKLVATEVTKAISSNRGFGRSDRQLLSEIRDSRDRVLTSTREALANASTQRRVESNSVAEKDREKATQLKLASKKIPYINLPVQGIDVGALIKIESLSYFRHEDKDIIRVELGHSLERFVSGEIIVIGKYKADGKERVLGCCGHLSKDTNGNVMMTSGVPFRAKLRVRKHIEIIQPSKMLSELVSVKIGIMMDGHPIAKYSDWINVKNEKLQSSGSAKTEEAAMTKGITESGKRDRSRELQAEKTTDARVNAPDKSALNRSSNTNKESRKKNEDDPATFSHSGGSSSLTSVLKALSRIGTNNKVDPPQVVKQEAYGNY